MKIADILARRSDLSTFLVHLTRTSAGRSGKNRLKEIIRGNVITANTPFGHATKKMTQRGLPTDNQKCACFTETPIEHVSLLVAPIDGRQVEFEPYGIVITKKQGRKYGVNPIWYLDITPGHNWLTNPLDQLVADAVKTGPTNPLFKLTPFIEQFGKGKDFSWEREWRKSDAFSLPERYIVLCPEREHPELLTVLQESGMTRDGVAVLDPSWSLETIIARLAGFYPHEVGAVADS